MSRTVGYLPPCKAEQEQPPRNPEQSNPPEQRDQSGEKKTDKGKTKGKAQSEETPPAEG